MPEWVAIWGAVAGTAALTIQAVQYFSRKSKIKVEAEMLEQLRGPNETVISIAVSVVNTGKGVRRIGKVRITVLPRAVPVQPDLRLVESSFQFECPDGAVPIAPDGGKHVFRAVALSPDQVRSIPQPSTAVFVHDTAGRVYTTNLDTQLAQTWLERHTTRAVR